MAKGDFMTGLKKANYMIIHWNNERKSFDILWLGLYQPWTIVIIALFAAIFHRNELYRKCLLHGYGVRSPLYYSKHLKECDK